MMDNIFSKREILSLLALALAGLISYLSGFDYLFAELLSHRTSVGISLFFSLEYYTLYMVVLPLFCLKKERKAGYAIVTAVILVFLMQALFTVFAPRSRPSQAMPIGDELLNLIKGAGGSSSFFSGHTASVVVVCTIFYLMRFHPTLIILLGLPIISSRLTLIQHYLSDVLGGIIFGYVTAKVCYHKLKGKK